MSQRQTALAKGEGSSLSRPSSGTELSSSQLEDTSSKLQRLIQKIKQRGDATWEKDELLDVVYWLRQLLGPALGVVWGMWPITGVGGITAFIITNIAITIGFYKSWLMLDEEEYGGHNELMLEGLGGSVSFFMVTWILAYTATQT